MESWDLFWKNLVELVEALDFTMCSVKGNM